MLKFFTNSSNNFQSLGTKKEISTGVVNNGQNLVNVVCERPLMIFKVGT